MFSKTNPLRHISKRKKRRQKQKRKHKTRTRQVVDVFAYGFSLLTPVMTLPQVHQIWNEKNVAGLALSTWAVYLVASVFWFLYGIVHKENQIMLVNFLFIILNFSIVLGIVAFG